MVSTKILFVLYPSSGSSSFSKSDSFSDSSEFRNSSPSGQLQDSVLRWVRVVHCSTTALLQVSVPPVLNLLTPAKLFTRSLLIALFQRSRWVSVRHFTIKHCPSTSFCPVWFDPIFTEIKVHQRWELCQHSSYNPLFLWSILWTSHCHELVQNEVTLFLFHTIVDVVSEAPDQSDNGDGWQQYLIHNLFDSLRGPSQHDRPYRHPSPVPVVSWDTTTI